MGLFALTSLGPQTVVNIDCYLLLLLQPSYLNGSVRDLVRSPESPSLRTMKTRDKLTLLQELLTKRKRRRKKRKKMNKSFKYQTE